MTNIIWMWCWTSSARLLLQSRSFPDAGRDQDGLTQLTFPIQRRLLSSYLIKKEKKKTQLTFPIQRGLLSFPKSLASNIIIPDVSSSQKGPHCIEIPSFISITNSAVATLSLIIKLSLSSLESHPYIIIIIIIIIINLFVEILPVLPFSGWVGFPHPPALQTLNRQNHFHHRFCHIAVINNISST